MPVETPLEALATPQLDGKRLVAFCKAMELTTLTRRVAEICGVDAGSIDPDPRFVGPAAWPGGQGVALLQREGEAPAEGAPPLRRASCSRAARAQGRPAGRFARRSCGRARDAGARSDRPRGIQGRTDRGRT